MKKWVWAIVTAIVVLLIGGYAIAVHHVTEQDYAAAMSRGRTAVSDKKYTQAETDFENALRRKPNDQTANTYLKQTQHFVGGQSAMTNQKFESASDNFKAVKDAKHGSKTLVNRANAELKKLKTIELNERQYQKLYDKAKAENEAQEYAQSSNTVAELLDSSSIKQPYYQTIYDKATALRKANDQALANEQTTPTAPKTPVYLDPNAQSASSNQEPTQGGLSQSDLNTAKSALQSSQSIPKGEIDEVRKMIDSAGGNANSMSDQDIKNAITQATQKQESIQEYASKYLK
ncbi:hypothetical protein [Levilactobacillus bambusae]|uniref:Uncharacterized protein n=1 Tax=Levilactobacillus bambusae TaxID=2024736 RepID=A0A2V1MY82_9LACO|nr:hypothetical protein [Levilactobacillus bambusae]PWF99732.1 hypothetical protein DCM90_06640 [Levilactobacillus bambusae]